MLVTILNTTDRSGGAGIAAFRLGRALESQGVQAPVVCLHRRFDDESTFRVRTRNSEVSRSLTAYREGIQRVEKRFITHNRTARSKTIFSSPWAGGHLVADNPFVAASRVLHLHWVNHFLDLHSLQELASLKRPIVWTLHDEWLYTAGCHYTSGCDQYLRRCTQCPQLLHDPYRLIEEWFDEKAAVFADLDLTVVTPSAWLGERARRSHLLRGKRVEVIRNAFDVHTFRPMDRSRRQALRARHGFDDASVVLGFGAQSLKDVRKGYGLLLAALTELVRQGKLPANVGLMVFGTRSEELDQLAGHVKVSYVGELHEEAAIADVLGSVDGFVVPSLEENYPNVIIEALLCGTPVIAYGCGGIPEQVREGENGLLVMPVGDVGALATALHRFCTEPRLREATRSFDRAAVAAAHDFPAVGAHTLRLYRELAPDFDAPLDPVTMTYLSERRRVRGAARDLLAVPSHRHHFQSVDVATLVADQVDAVFADRRSAEASQQERLYKGFFDQTHRFGAGGTGLRFLTRGWSAPEAQGTWSAERTAGIALEVPAEVTELELALVGQCKGAAQTMVIRVGVEEVARVKLASSRARHDVLVRLPRACQGGGIVQLLFDFPHAQKEPNSIRSLGLYLSELSATARSAAPQQTTPPAA